VEDVDDAEAASVEAWIRRHVDPTGPIELVHKRPWATVLRIPLAIGCAYFKACAPAYAFEPRLTYALFSRWPDRVGEVLAVDAQRAWLLLAGAGTQLRLLGNHPEVWLRALPLYAELQRGEADRAEEYLAQGVPDQRFERWPTRYTELLLEDDLPLTSEEIHHLTDLAPRFAQLCHELAEHRVPDTVQHDDLHYNNLFVSGEQVRVLDWGDSSISHPFVSLVVTFRFLQEFNGLRPTDAWFKRLQDAYLEPWGVTPGSRRAFPLALRLGSMVHAFGWLRQRRSLPLEARAEFDKPFAVILRRALAQFT
jgi:hypothetical protein